MEAYKDANRNYGKVILEIRKIKEVNIPALEIMGLNGADVQGEFLTGKGESLTSEKGLLYQVKALFSCISNYEFLKNSDKILMANIQHRRK